MYRNSIENRWKKPTFGKTVTWTRHNNQLHFRSSTTWMKTMQIEKNQQQLGRERRTAKRFFFFFIIINVKLYNEMAERTVRCNANKLNHGMTSWKHASHEDTLRTEHTKVNWKMQADLDNDNSTVKAMAHKLIILFLQHACGHVMKSCSNHFFSAYSLFGNALLHCASFATVLTGWSLLLDKLERLYCEAR